VIEPAMSKSSKHYSIGEIADLVGVSTDTLRYYEKIELLPSINRTASGIRSYSEKDLSRLRFIRRAQKMNFSLNEISDLLQMRDDPQNARTEVRELTQHRLEEISTHLKELERMRNELQLLVNLCKGSSEGCPIIEEIDDSGES